MHISQSRPNLNVKDITQGFLFGQTDIRGFRMTPS